MLNKDLLPEGEATMKELNTLDTLLASMRKEQLFYLKLSKQLPGYAQGYADGIGATAAMIENLIMAGEVGSGATQSEDPSRR